MQEDRPGGPAPLIVWIRKELRARDHVALWSAARDAPSVLPLYILDRSFLSSPAARRTLILESLRHLRADLEKIGGNLFVRTGEPHEVIVQLARETGAAGVCVTRSYDPAVVSADARLAGLLASEGRPLREFKDDVIFEKTELVNSSGEPFRVYSAYRRAWLGAKETIPPPLPVIRAMRSPRVAPGEIPEPAPEYGPAPVRVPAAGEAAALRTLDRFLRERAGSYGNNRDLLAVDGTSRLSHHLALGSVSVRSVYGALRGAKGTAGGRDAFLRQIIWRDFFKQILANFPHVAGRSFREEFDAVPWKTNVGLYNAWRDGVTGYPVVDAAMRQLKQEGWMHNRGRMIAASFLTKDLHIDWRMGERHFMEWLADGDLALNNGGWQWSAGSGTDAQPWYRIFNPVLQGRKFDPEGAYVKKYIPELSGVPAGYVHAPWEMPASVAADAGVRIGHDYPAPIVDHAAERRVALERYRPGRRGKPRGSDGLFYS